MGSQILEKDGCILKLKTKLKIAFVTLIALPILLTSLAVFGFGMYQINVIEKTYDISEATYESLSNSVQIMNRMVEKSYKELEEISRRNPQKIGRASCRERVCQYV